MHAGMDGVAVERPCCVCVQMDKSIQINGTQRTRKGRKHKRKIKRFVRKRVLTVFRSSRCDDDCLMCNRAPTTINLITDCVVRSVTNESKKRRV